MMRIYLLLLLLFEISSAHFRSIDWSECNDHACFVHSACKGKQGAATLEAVGKQASTMTKKQTCPFVMILRPFNKKMWIVQMRVHHSTRIKHRWIKFRSDSKMVADCEGNDNGKVTVKPDQGLKIEVHPDSYFMHNQIYCKFTLRVPKANSLSLNTLLEQMSIEYNINHETKLAGAFPIWNFEAYKTCDGSMIDFSTIRVPGGATTPVDAAHAVLSCPPGPIWTMMVEQNGEFTKVTAARCDVGKDGHAYEYEIEDKMVYRGKEDTIKMACVAQLGCASCAAPALEPCVGCAPVVYRPGTEKECAKIECHASFSNHFRIGSKFYTGIPQCAQNKDGFGWIITDANGETVHIDQIACVQEGNCHDTSPLSVNCDQTEGCVQPIAVEYVEGTGLRCPDQFSMRYQSNASELWNSTIDLMCDAKRGDWLAEQDNVTHYLPPFSTVQCIADSDPFLPLAVFTVCGIVVLEFIGFIVCCLWKRKSRAESDRRIIYWSREIRKLHEMPRSPEQSTEEVTAVSRRSIASLMEELDGKKTDKQESTSHDSKSNNTKEKEKVKEKEPPKKPKVSSVAVFLRPREVDDPADAYCKSEKGNEKDTWEQWIKKHGGVVQDKKPREEILRLRAEKKEAKEKAKREAMKREAERNERKAKKDEDSLKIEHGSMEVNMEELMRRKTETEEKGRTENRTRPPTPPDASPPRKASEQKDVVPEKGSDGQKSGSNVDEEIVETSAANKTDTRETPPKAAQNEGADNVDARAVVGDGMQGAEAGLMLITPNSRTKDVKTKISTTRTTNPSLRTAVSSSESNETLKKRENKKTESNKTKIQRKTMLTTPMKTKKNPSSQGKEQHKPDIANSLIQ